MIPAALRRHALQMDREFRNLEIEPLYASNCFNTVPDTSVSR